MRFLRMWLLLLTVALLAGCATSGRTKAWEADIERGDTAMGKHDFKTARDAYSAAVDKAGHFKAKDPRLSQSLSKLASVLFADRQYLEAKTLCERVVAVEEKRLGGTNVAMADNYVRLAEVDETMKLYQEADHLYQKASELVESDSGVSTPVIGVYMARRAHIYSKMEQYELAYSLYDRAIKFIEDAQFNLSFSQQLSDERSMFMVESARARNEYGLLCLKLGRCEEAEKLFVRAIDTLEAKFSKSSPALAPVTLNLAKAFLQEDNFDAAENAAGRALKIAEKSMDPTNPIVVEIKEFITAVDVKRAAAEAADSKTKK